MDSKHHNGVVHSYWSVTKKKIGIVKKPSEGTCWKLKSTLDWRTITSLIAIFWNTKKVKLEMSVTSHTEFPVHYNNQNERMIYSVAKSQKLRQTNDLEWELILQKEQTSKKMVLSSLSMCSRKKATYTKEIVWMQNE